MLIASIVSLVFFDMGIVTDLASKKLESLWTLPEKAVAFSLKSLKKVPKKVCAF